MSKEKWRVPKLRFPGFTEDWEQRKLSDILKVNSGKDYKHLEQGDIPVYGTGGYMLSVNESLSNIDAIGIGRKGTIDKPQYLKAPFWTVDTLFYLTALDKHSILFLYYLMQLMPWKKFDESTGVPSLSKTTIDNINGYVPSNPKEEELISALFNQLDKSITLHQRKLNNLKLKKKALLQKLFPKNGERYPELRFPGFTDAWEQRKFSDITYLSGIKNKENKPYESYSISNEFGFIPQDEQFENGGTMKTADKSMYYIVSQNSFAYNPARINVGSIGYYDKPNNVIVSSLYEVFKTIDIVNDKFLWHWFKSNQFNRLIEKYQEGGVRLYFYYDKLCKGTIDLPTINEQNKISNLLDRLDLYITLHQRKLDHLQLQKKALLQQMFV